MTSETENKESATDCAKLSILYQDTDYVVIDKPSGLLVHRSALARDTTISALESLRDQIGQEVHPCHRLDRPTSGALLFALNREALKNARLQFEKGVVKKTYLAIVRGWTEAEGMIDYPLKTEDGRARIQEATTEYQTIEQAELPRAVGRYHSARFSLLRLRPLTGRTHQIRRHLAHIRHPIIGDSRHGDGAQNRFSKEQLKLNGLMLRSIGLELEIPPEHRIKIDAGLDVSFTNAVEVFGFSLSKIKRHRQQGDEQCHQAAHA